MNIIQHIILMRPNHWIKNIFVFAPTFFSGKITNLDILNSTILSAVCFSLVSSSVYILNDIIDRQSDSLHPKKKFRPIANGSVSPISASILALLIIFFAFSIIFNFLPNSVLKIIGIYFFLNVFYSSYLKKYAIIDVACIAIGFVLRLFAGSNATGIELSSWMISMTFLISLFLAFAKRRDDLIFEEIEGKKIRKSIDGYSRIFLDHAMSVMASVVIVSYLMYCYNNENFVSSNTENLFLTTFFVVVGLLRYIQLSLIESKTNNPIEVLSRDRFTQINLLLWTMTYIWILY